MSELNSLEAAMDTYNQATRGRQHPVLHAGTWDHEPPDQRVFRLYNKKALWVLDPGEETRMQDDLDEVMGPPDPDDFGDLTTYELIEYIRPGRLWIRRNGPAYFSRPGNRFVVVVSPSGGAGVTPRRRRRMIGSSSGPSTTSALEELGNLRESSVIRLAEPEGF